VENDGVDGDDGGDGGDDDDIPPTKLVRRRFLRAIAKSEYTFKTPTFEIQ